MFGSAALDTAIGLVTIFLMLSLICSAINEMLASLTNRRGSFLRKGIAGIFAEAGEGPMPPRTRAFFEDRRIQSLCKTDGRIGQTIGAISRSAGPDDRRLPSYVPPETFGAVTIDLASGATGLGPGARLARAAAFARVEVSGAPATIDPMKLLVRDAVERASESKPRLLDEEPAVAMKRIESALGEAFDDTMERASGWYRRRTQVWLFCIAIFVVLAINADTLVIIRHLAVDEKARTALAEIGAAQAREQLNTEGMTAEQRAKAYADRGKEILESTRGVSLPLGWTGTQFMTATTTSEWFLKTLGLLMTAIAVALGAPFWFDVLQKLANLRSAGVKPAGSSDSNATNDGNTGKSGKSGSAGGSSVAVVAGSGGSGAAISPANGSTVLSITPSNAATVPALAPGYWSDLVKAGPWDQFAPAQDLHLTRLRLAQLSAIAYRPEAIAQEMLVQIGADRCKCFNVGGTQAFVCALHDDAVISFRGTQPRELQDLLADANIAWRGFPNGDMPPARRLGMVHAGFSAALECVYDEVEKHALKLHEGGAIIWITGHSLGGALATLMFARLVTAHAKLASQVRLVTFASPRVGDGEFLKAFEKVPLKDLVHHITLERDPVPLVPPFSMGYRQLGAITTLSIGGIESTGESWRAILDTIIDASTDLRRAGAESLRRHGIEVYIAALEMAAEAATSRT